jgi:hypothetical protein
MFRWLIARRDAARLVERGLSLVRGYGEEARSERRQELAASCADVNCAAGQAAHGAEVANPRGRPRRLAAYWKGRSSLISAHRENGTGGAAMRRFWPFLRCARLRLSPMRRAGRARLFGAALAAAALFAAPGLARADGCDFGDLWNAVDNTVSSLASGNCGTACVDPTTCAAAGVLAGALAGIAASQGQSAASDMCNQLNAAVGDVNALESWLAPLGETANLVNEVGLGGAVSAAQCACDMEQGVGSLASDLGACLVAFYQWLSCNIPGVYCPCTPSPPQQVDCSQIMNEDSNPSPAQVKQVANGTLVVAAFETCSPTYCFCPSPMVLGVTPILGMNGSCPCDYCNPGTPSSWCPTICECYWNYSCQCPPNTKPAASSGPLSQICICNNTHLAAVPPDKGGPCPIPLTGIPCPQGQANYKGQCVPACASNQVRAPDGHCCDPSQVTSCGTCCPPGWQPNLTDGTCSTPIIQ